MCHIHPPASQPFLLCLLFVLAVGREAGNRYGGGKGLGEGGKREILPKHPQVQVQIHNFHSCTHTKNIFNQVNKTILNTLLLVYKYGFIIILNIFLIFKKNHPKTSSEIYFRISFFFFCFEGWFLTTCACRGHRQNTAREGLSIAGPGKQAPPTAQVWPGSVLGLAFPLGGTDSPVIGDTSKWWGP